MTTKIFLGRTILLNASLRVCIHWVHYFLFSMINVQSVSEMISNLSVRTYDPDIHDRPIYKPTTIQARSQQLLSRLTVV